MDNYNHSLMRWTLGTIADPNLQVRDGGGGGGCFDSSEVRSASRAPHSPRACLRSPEKRQKIIIK